MKRRFMTAPLIAMAIATVATLGATAPQAQTSTSATPTRVAVISLIGDELNVVTYRGQTGSHGLGNQRQTYPMPDPVFDNTALAATTRALTKRFPGLKVAEVAPPKAGSEADPAQLLANGKPTASPVFGALKANGFSHLVLIAKHREQARLRFIASGVGHGQLSGLGYYIDHDTPNIVVDTGEQAVGFMAAYVYAKAWLVDLAAPAVIAEQPVTDNQVVGGQRATLGADPWSALSDRDKVRLLREIVDKGLEGAVTRLFDAR